MSEIIYGGTASGIPNMTSRATNQYLVTKSSRQIVDEYFEVFEKTDDPSEAMTAIGIRLKDGGIDTLHAFYERLESTRCVERVMAACFVLQAKAKLPDYEQESVVIESAHQVFKSALVARSIEDVICGVVFLSIVDVPSPLVPTLVSLARHHDERVRVGAICALERVRPLDSEMVGELQKGLESSFDAVRLWAAAAMMRRAVGVGRAEFTIRSLLHAVPPPLQYSLLMAVGSLESKALPLIDSLLECLDDPAFSNDLQGQIAYKVGEITRSSNSRLPELRKAITSRVSAVVAGAINGMAVNECLTDEDWALIAEKLCHKNRFVRRAAADAMRRSDVAALRYVTMLIERLEHERDREVLVSLVSAIANVGDGAVSALVQGLRRDDPWLTIMVFEVFAQRQVAGLKSLLALPTQENVAWLPGFVLLLAHRLGPRGRIAVDQITCWLSRTSDDEFAMVALGALCSMGATDQACAATVPWLFHHNAEVAQVAARVITGAGHLGRASIESALKTASGKEILILRQVLDQIPGAISGEFLQLMGSDEKILRKFILVGRVMRGLGKHSWPQLSRLITQQLTPTQADGYSATNLGHTFRQLRNQWGCPPLIEHISGRHSKLTSEGLKRLEWVEAYLEMLDSRVNTPRTP